MKLSTLAIALTLAACTGSAFAKEVVFKPILENFETQVCLTAATEGLNASKALILENEQRYSTFTSSLTCNGLSLASFANKYTQVEEQAPKNTKPVTLIAKNTNIASKVCLDALVMGETKARQKHNITKDHISCNNQNISRFVRRYSNETVIVRNSED